MRLGRFVIAIVAGVVVAAIVYQTSVARVAAEAEVPVIVAARDLAARTVLTRDLVTLTTMPRRAVPAGALATTAEADGRVLRDPIFAGEIVSDRHLAGPGADLSASLLIPAGEPYAFNLPIAMFLSAPPRLQLHDRVDIVAYPRGRPVSEGGVIVSDLEIIDLSPRTTDNASGSALLTVAAAADEIVKILAARDGHVLALAVRPFRR